MQRTDCFHFSCFRLAARYTAMCKASSAKGIPMRNQKITLRIWGALLAGAFVMSGCASQEQNLMKKDHLDLCCLWSGEQCTSKDERIRYHHDRLKSEGTRKNSGAGRKAAQKHVPAEKARDTSESQSSAAQERVPAVAKELTADDIFEYFRRSWYVEQESGGDARGLGQPGLGME